jgi:hypothetical protein
MTKTNKYELTPELKPAVRESSSEWFSAAKDSDSKKSSAVTTLATLLKEEYGSSSVTYTDSKPLYLVTEYKNLITIEWLLGYKSAFEEALKKFKKDLDEGVVGKDAPEPVTKETVKRYARDFMTALKNDHCIEFNTNGRKLNQAEKDKLEAKAIKSRAVTATKKTASSVASNITSMIGDIRDLANELVNRKGDKVRSPSAKKALTQLDRIEKTVSKKLETLLK